MIHLYKEIIMKNIVRTFLLSAGLLVASSCELDLLDNPNEVSLDQTNPDFVLNNIQIAFADFFENMSEFGMDNTRMNAMFGNNYDNAYQATTFDGVWTSAYAGIMADAKLINDLAADDATLDYHVGVARFFRAYTAMMVVDYFGDVPYSEILDPSNFNPSVDAGSDIYASALADIEAAIDAFEAVDNATNLPDLDLYYGLDPEDYATSVDKWLAACNTLKLRAYLQTRLVNAAQSTTVINDLIANANLIDTDAEAFAFRYPGNSIAAPDTRHPWFSQNYITGAAQYMSNSYIKELFDGKGGVRDPRLRYYFYRQTLSIPTDVNVLDCINQARPAHYAANDVFCFVGNGYWGRDHLDDDGIPPDNLVRTIYGLYPAGGEFDASQGAPGSQDSGNGGEGILPMMLPSFTLFMQAEAATELGTTGNPRTLLDQAIRSSIAYVMAFNPALVPAANVPSAATINTYVNGVLADYDAAADKLHVVIKEYWIALWGNGVDMYNTYRRTGKPTDMQPALNPTPGAIYRSFTYPSVFVNRNSNATAKPSTAVQVFWDTNPAGFID